MDPLDCQQAFRLYYESCLTPLSLTSEAVQEKQSSMQIYNLLKHGKMLAVEQTSVRGGTMDRLFNSFSTVEKKENMLGADIRYCIQLKPDSSKANYLTFFLLATLLIKVFHQTVFTDSSTFQSHCKKNGKISSYGKFNGNIIMINSFPYV